MSTTEGASDMVEGVSFSFMTDEEVRKHSVLKVTNPILLDPVGRPMLGGLYDPLLGPIDDQAPCKSCGQQSFNCPGHCGHIDLVSPVYNPLLFDMLYTILRQTCFFCRHFKARREEVEVCTTKLTMIAQGDVTGAKNYVNVSDSKDIDMEESDGNNVSSSGSQSDGPAQTHNDFWTSVQYIEAKSVLKDFLSKPSKSCHSCECKNPKITKPTFGSFRMEMSVKDAEKNHIKGYQLGSSRDEEELLEDEDDKISEVINVNEQSEEDRVDTAGTGASAASSSKRKNVKKKKSKVPLDFMELKKRYSGSLLPSRVISIIKDLWENEAGLCSFICDMQQLNGSVKSNYSMFFIKALLVPPTKFRPAAVAGDSVMENPQTVLLGKVVQSNDALGKAHISKLEGSKIADRWKDLQQSVNVLFDSKTATNLTLKSANTGICQLLEKKEGIFRQKMMGKRVNYACRSVISPDPYLAVNEIGVPPYFALRLTYPERVTPWNAGKLKDAIINGSNIHPGATHYADKVSTVRLPQSKKMRISISRKLPSSRGTGIQTKKSSDYEFEGKVVYRHLQDGDIVLVNRQPTLHKPSIMAHVVRVLKGEKTLRMHYANCSSYNADFDGDEMNVHLPQDEISRAEAYNIVNANNQYIVPTRGDTVRGLIQDHIVSSVLLTMKDTFLDREDFNQLLYTSGVFAGGGSSQHGKVSIVDKACHVEPVFPAVLKPKPLWTGKQVITAILNHLTRGYKPCIVDNKVKIPEQYFQGKEVKQDKNKTNKRLKKELAEFDNANLKEADETRLLIWKNELVCGVIDKAQFGKYGLVHTVQELYGPDIAGLLLGAFSRLFTSFLQFHGFTCGLDDLMVAPDCDKEMRMELEGEDVGEKVHRKFVNLENQKIGTRELQLETEKIIRSNGVTATASLDNLMQTELRDKGSMISKKWLPKGLLKPFPQNCISLMTISGAKGSSVNFQQISFLLGQQELEGKRVPRMVSGKTLPSFSPWDFTSRAGGYIVDRFLTGLRPQEYYFHCMAGREGLVDTAVKTSRSGYLQRCLIKNLESLKVSYDHTVRDADGSIVQFYYGEDGVDVHQTSFLSNLQVLKSNQEIINQKLKEPLEFNSYIQELPQGVKDKVKSFKHRNENREDLLMLIRQKYLSSLAHPGEPVGVIAGQSVGEPSTQMTLNTFHLAGRGEMNVTLGIPRLQEILMTAAPNIKTPMITCPLLQGRSMEDAERLVEKVKKLSVAEVMQSIEVSKLPLVLINNQPCRVYKLIVKLKKPKHVSLQNCQETLRNIFLRALEDTIERHIALLSRINGIKSVKNSKSDGAGDDDSGSNLDRDDGHEDDQEDDDDDDNEKDETADDLGADYNKRKRQNTDSVEYESSEEEDEDGEEEEEEKEASSDLENDGVEGKDDGKTGKEVESESESDDETNGGGLAKEQEQEDKDMDKAKLKPNEEFVTRKFDRSTFVEVKDLSLEVHFRFTNEPEILLAEVVQKAAKKVYIKGSGKLDQCQPVKYSVNVKQVCWNQNHPEIKKMNEKVKNNDNKKEENKHVPCALQASGVELPAFWDMEQDLDVDHVYSNNIHTMLNTYGVEAARTSIIMEMQNVFGSYGVEIDYRHLSLIADYMTHSGGYRPMSRFGSISESVSPFHKMSFETASKFIVEAASHSMMDNLETPTARICLGLPVKVGTGSMELMQKLDL
ncbi:putative DNA-directed RNA polymerase [Helianthus annuus]|nr:putative DNA-directed RNA polymerase [Helianthus annuus]KAJ0742993.1 putative DNA-directed RNA polymerase [Helianthus annuus]